MTIFSEEMKSFGSIPLSSVKVGEIGSSLSFLLQEANNLFGTSSMQYRSLLVLKQIRALREIGSSHYAISEKVKFIQQSLEIGSLI